MTGYQLNTRPNEYGCHDPQCLDSTWDHECPVLPPGQPEVTPTRGAEMNDNDSDQWHILPEADDDDDELPSKWAPVIMTGIIALAVILICAICGETVTSAVSAIWGKS